MTPDSGMTVLHLIPSLVGGGAERQLALLAPAMSKMGVRVHVACLHGGVNAAPLMDAGVPFHRVPAAGNHDPRVVLTLCRLIRKIQPDLVQTWLTQMDVMGAMAARIMGVPHILSERSSASMYPRNWKNRIRLQVGRRADVVVANSVAGRDYWRDAGRRGPCRVIRNAVPVNEIAGTPAADPAELGLAREARLIVFAGRFSSEKGPLVAVDAATLALEGRSDLAAAFFGNGPMEGAMRDRAGPSLARGSMCFPGYAADFWRWLRAACVLIAPSEVEGHPNVVLEAAAAGVPLVLSDIPAHRELFDEQAAVFCQPHDAAAFGRAIHTVVDRPAEAADRVEAARGRTAALSVESAALGYLAIYREIIAKPG